MLSSLSAGCPSRKSQIVNQKSDLGRSHVRAVIPQAAPLRKTLDYEDDARNRVAADFETSHDLDGLPTASRRLAPE